MIQNSEKQKAKNALKHRLFAHLNNHLAPELKSKMTSQETELLLNEVVEWLYAEKTAQLMSDLSSNDTPQKESRLTERLKNL